MLTIFQILIPDGTKPSFPRKKVSKDSILESLYKMRIRASVQLKTVLAMCEQEIQVEYGKEAH